MNTFKWNISNKSQFLEEVNNMFYGVISNDFLDNRTNLTNFLSIDEMHRSKYAIDSKKTDIGLYDVYYYKNKFGARGNWDLYEDAFNIAFFGCSFTFGDGMDENDIFPNIVGNYLKDKYENINVINLGFPGGSIDTSLKLFKYLTDVISVNLAVFLLPTHFRYQYMNKYNDKVIYRNIIPNVIDKTLVEYFNSFYHFNNDVILKYEAQKNISLIKYIADFKNVKTLFSSWDIETYSFIDEVIRDNKSILPYYRFVEKYENKKFARDGMHPAFDSNIEFANNIINKI